MITVSCKVCGFNNRLIYNQKLVGKKVRFACKNPSCKKSVEYTFPKVESINKEYETVVTDYTPRALFDGLVLWEDKESQHKEHYLLNVGTNIIGRLSNQKSPDIAIPTGDKTMSRMHCVISKITQNETPLYLLKEYSNKNPLILNGKILEKGSEVFLEKGDIIKMGKTDIQFTTLDSIG